MYYYDSIVENGFFAILLLGFVILAYSILNFLSWQNKWKTSVKSYSKALKNMFNVFMILSIILSGFGAIVYVLSMMDKYTLEPLEIETMLILMTVGLVVFVLSIISWIYVMRSMPDVILNESMKLQRVLDQIKASSDAARTAIKSKMDDIDGSLRMPKKQTKKSI